MMRPGGREPLDRPAQWAPRTWDPKAMARHIGCILALMWMPIVNGQPFFFPDTTSYVRAADLAVYLGSGGRLSTAWTTRYEADLKSAKTPQPAASQSPAVAGNDLRSGNIMSGRSPYFGSLLYIAYLLSGFWLFVIGQAATCYALILLAMRRLGLAEPRDIVLTVAALSLGTGVAYYNGLLMADALAGFGIVAFLLLATDGGRSSKIVRAFLFLVILVSAMSHLTHIVMLAGMMAALAGLRWLRLVEPSRGALPLAGGALVISVLSLYLTSFAITHIFGKPPQLVPLMTARFVEDGTGRDFIAAGCHGRDFFVCGVQLPPNLNSQTFLWGHNGADSVFMQARPAERARMAAEDTQFALAVWQAYPVRQTLALIGNSIEQMLIFGADGLDQDCFRDPLCWTSLPEAVRGRLRASMSGQGLWPDRLMSLIYYAVVGAAVLAIALRAWPVLAKAPAEGRVVIGWLVLFLVAMAICDVLGGAISDPQYRYQGRLIWILPFLAILTLLLDRRTSRAAA